MATYYIYGDESGVFDRVHQQYFVYGGLLLPSDSVRDNFYRKYLAIEKEVRKNYLDKGSSFELKASSLMNKDRMRLFRSTNGLFRYAFIIHLRKLNDDIFISGKTKQQFRDFSYKLGIKRMLEYLLCNGTSKKQIERLRVNFDNHSIASSGLYNLEKSIKKELKEGMTNPIHGFFPPILPDIKGVSVKYRNSEHDALIRASDIIANVSRRYYLNGEIEKLRSKAFLFQFPEF